MEKIIYTNKFNDEIKLTYSFPDEISLVSIEGLGKKETKVTTSDTFNQNGAIIESVKLGVRPIRLKLQLNASSTKRLYELKRQINRIFATLRSPGILRYQNNLMDVKCQVVVTRCEESNLKVFGRENYVIDLLANNPFLLNSAQKLYYLEDFIGGFTLPFEFSIQLAITDSSIKIENSGDVKTPMNLEVLGDGVAPIKIEKLETSEYIEINVDLLVGEKLIIDTDNYTVKKIDANGNEESAYNLVNIYSTFFDINVGINTLKISSAGGNPLMIIKYNERYEGV